MTYLSFNTDIRPIFKDYVDKMKKVVLVDDDGTESLDLSNYEHVKRFNIIIQAVIHGYEDGSTVPHKMPPSGPLCSDDIKKFDQWISDGMHV